ncbi:redox-sensing transcriptional repressor Rex [bacterium]|nr:redox-sensing transcriptional repressor Rex [bacterium]MBU1936335.1 redox-sensing transcriptional repressor Rex [bacterium]
MNSRTPSKSRSSETSKISDATVKRLSKYYRTLQNAIGSNKVTISSEEIARINGLTAAQVRKDLSFFGAFGRRGLGYNVADLHRNISRILGLHRTWNVCIVGVGNIGRALVRFKQFQEQGFYIKLIMDSDSTKWGQTVGDLTIESSENCKELVRREKIKIAILAVPASAAQRVVDRLVDAGVKAILNFAPVSIFAPPGVYVRNENMAIEIESLSFALTNKSRK